MGVCALCNISQRDEIGALREEVRALRKSQEEFESLTRQELQLLPKDIVGTVKRIQAEGTKFRQECGRELGVFKDELQKVVLRIGELDDQVASVNKLVLEVREEIGTDSELL